MLVNYKTHQREITNCLHKYIVIFFLKEKQKIGNYSLIQHTLNIFPSYHVWN